MYRRAAMVVLSFWVMSSFAEDWQTVAETQLGRLKMDLTKLSSEGKYASAILVYEFKDLQRLSTQPYSVFNKREDNVLVDCPASSFGLHTSRFYEDEKLVNTYSRDISKVVFNPPAADSMASTVVKAVCVAIAKGKN